MSHSHRFRIAPAAGLAALCVVALLLAATALPGAPSAPLAPAARTAPSYAGLRALLRQGEGKGLEKGFVEVWQDISPVPTGWVWVQDDTSDGSGVEYWIYSDAFVHPNADDDVQMTFVYRTDVDFAELAEAVDWVVRKNPGIHGAGDLKITENVVSKVQ